MGTNTLGVLQKYVLVEVGINVGKPAVGDADDLDVLNAVLANPDVNVLTDSEYASLLGLIAISGTLPDYVHIQAIASTVWVISHGMDDTPDVRFVDVSNNEIEPAVVYDTILKTITATFASPIAGVATVEGVFSGVGGVGNAFVDDPLSQFASTTSAQLASVISDETGSGSLVFATSPVLVTPSLGVASCTSLNKVAIPPPITGATINLADGVTLTVSANATVSGNNSGDQVNISGNAGTVTTIPVLSGEVTNVGNAITLLNASVISKVLTGYVSGAGTVSATDTILQAIQKLNGNESKFDSTPQVITSGGLLSIAHGLASIPQRVNAFLNCVVAEFGYAIGDRLFLGLLPILNNQGVSISPTATVINLRYGSLGNVFSIVNKTTGATQNATNANWRLNVQVIV